MVDYTKATGAGGEMMIRDQGRNIEFHVRAGSSSTWGSGFPWSGRVNGVNVGGTFDYSTGRPWKHIATYTVTTNQQVRFSLGDTGTSGLGGPTDLFVNINRATVPPPPSPIGLDQVTHNTVRYRFQSTGTGGSPILEWQVGYGYSPSKVQFSKPSSGTITLATFYVGATVYAWARGRNAVGWSGWSARSSVQLKRGCRVRSGGVWAHAIPYVRHNGVWKPAEPYIRHNGAWKLAAYTG